MTIFESINSKNIEEFAAWLDKYGVYDNSAWCKWFDENYCNKCESEYAYVDYLNKECECSWCEIHNKCRYFQDMSDTPDNIDIIKMWLETEAENEGSI